MLSVVSIDKYNRFGYSAFDLGVYDQGIWLLSRGKSPFVTVEGMNLFGDHIQFIVILFAPLYWIWNDVRILLIFQSVILSAGVIPLYLIAKDRFKNKFIPLIFVFSYLLYPPLHFLNLESFYPVSFAVPVLFFTFYFLVKKKYLWYLFFIILSLLTREELTLTAIAFGIFAFIRNHRKIGLITIIVSVVWLYVSMNFVIPYINGFDYFTKRPFAFGEFGRTPTEAIKNMILNPKKVLKSIFTDQNVNYIFDLFAPVGFLSFLHPLTLFLATPALSINLLSGWWYMHEIEYHYTYAIIPFVFISLVYGISAIRDFLRNRLNTIWSKYITVFLFAILIIFSLVENNKLSPPQTSMFRTNFIKILKNFNRYSEREQTMKFMLTLIPENASVSASYLFVPHLTHREIIYMFPNPFREVYWGAYLGNYTPPPPTNYTDYIVVDNTIERSDKQIINFFLKRNIYLKIFEKDDLILLKRNPNRDS